MYSDCRIPGAGQTHAGSRRLVTRCDYFSLAARPLSSARQAKVQGRSGLIGPDSFDAQF
jgi:hypothetical protein